MKVKDLIEELESLPADLEVVVEAGEFSHFVPCGADFQARFCYNPTIPDDKGIGPVVVIWC